MPLAVNIVNDILARRSMPLITVDQYLDLFDHPVSDFYKAIGFDLDRVPFADIAREFGQSYAAHCPSCTLQEGALQTLQHIEELHISQSILSASHREPLERFVLHHGVRRFFSHLVGLDDHFAHSKVEQGRLWLASHHTSPDEVLLIGDTTHDYEVSQELGCDCLLVAVGHQSRQRLERCSVPTFASLTAIPSYLERVAPSRA